MAAPSQHMHFKNIYNSAYSEDYIVCDWEVLRSQLLHQWQRLTALEIDSAGPNRRQLARLIARKYGIAFLYVENYLCNFERTLPV